MRFESSSKYRLDMRWNITEEERKAGLDIADFCLRDYKRSESTSSNIPVVKSKNEIIKEQLISKNPLLQSMIDKFDLRIDE